MTDSASTLLAVLFGLGVFAVIVAIGWRSVQNRRILRLRGADGQETIIVAREDDDISSVVTTTAETARAAPAPEFGRAAARSESTAGAEADVSGLDRPGRGASSDQ